MIQDAPPTSSPSENELSPELDRRLDDLQREVHAQGAGIRVTERGFAIFAAFALLISMTTLIAVAAKLQKKTVTISKTVPASRAPAAPAAFPSTVTERLTEMKIAGSAATVAAGKVTFRVSNDGAAAHELVVLQTGTQAAKLPTSASGRADESGNIGETGDMKVGDKKTLTLNLKPGHYALICNLPGHYSAGMYADLTVK